MRRPGLARNVAILGARPPERLDDEERAELATLRTYDPVVETACWLGQGFAPRLLELVVERLDA